MKNLQWHLPQFLSDHKAIIMFFQTNEKGAPGHHLSLAG